MWFMRLIQKFHYNNMKTNKVARNKLNKKNTVFKQWNLKSIAEIKENIKTCSWIGRTNIVKMTILQNQHNPHDNWNWLFAEINMLILTFIWKCKGSRRSKIILKNKSWWLSYFQNLLENYNNQDCGVGKKINTDQRNRAESWELNLYIYFWKSLKTIQWEKNSFFFFSKNDVWTTKYPYVNPREGLLTVHLQTFMREGYLWTRSVLEVFDISLTSKLRVDVQRLMCSQCGTLQSGFLWHPWLPDQ